MSTYRVGPDGTVRMSSDDKLREYTKFKRDQDVSFEAFEDRQRCSRQRAAIADEAERDRVSRQFLVTLEQQILGLGRLTGMPHQVAEAWTKRLMMARWNPFERDRLMMESTALATCPPSRT